LDYRICGREWHPDLAQGNKGKLAILANEVHTIDTCMTKAQAMTRGSAKMKELAAMNMPPGTKKAVYMRLVSIGEIPKKYQLRPEKVDAFFGIVEK
jgi:hypothetical protein